MAQWLCPFICMLLLHKTVGQVFVGPAVGSGAQATQKVQKQAMDAPTALRLHRYRDLSFEANATTIVFLGDAEAAVDLSGCVVVGALATGLRAEDEYQTGGHGAARSGGGTPRHPQTERYGQRCGPGLC